MTSLEELTVQTFTVPGVPTPQGSMVALRSATTGKPIVKSQSKGLKAYRADISYYATQLKIGPFPGSVRVSVVFYMPRPKSHYRANGELKPTAPNVPTAKSGPAGGDIDKLSRAVLDALAGANVIDNDAMVVSLAADKLYAEGYGPATTISIMDWPS